VPWLEQNLCLKVLGTPHVTAILESSAGLEQGPYGKQLSELFSQLLLRRECLLPASAPACSAAELLEEPPEVASAFTSWPDSQTHVALM